MSADALEPYKRRKVSPVEEPDEQWLVDFQRANLVARLESRDQQLAAVQSALDSIRTERDALVTRLAAISDTWATLASDIEVLSLSFPGATIAEAGPIVDLLSRYQCDLPSLRAFTGGAFRGLLAALDAVAGERAAQDAETSCGKCVNALLKASSQKCELQGRVAALGVRLEQKCREAETLGSQLETAQYDRENLRGRWENAKKAASCICPCRCGARCVSFSDDLEDVKQLKTQLESQQTECDRLRQSLEEKEQLCIRLELESSVSEERFIGCKAYRTLMGKAKSVLDRLSDERRQYKSLDKRYEKQRREHEKETKEQRTKCKDLEWELESRTRESAKTIERLEREKQAKGVEVEQLQARLGKWEEHLASFQSVSEKLESELAESRKKVAEYSQSNHVFKQRSEELDKQLTEVKLQLTDRHEKVASLNQHIVDLTAGLAAEPNPEARAIRLQKERDDLLHKIKARDDEIHQLKGKLGEFGGKLRAEQEAFQLMHREYDVTAAAFDKEAKKAKALGLQVAKQDRDIAQLVSEKLGFDAERKLWEEERARTKLLLDAKDGLVGKLKGEIDAQSKLITDYVRAVSDCRTQIKENEDQLARATQMYENHLKDREEWMSEKEKALELSHVLEGKLTKSHEVCAERTQRMQELTSELSLCHEELLKAANLENQKSSDEAINQQLARFRAMVRCSQCSSALKDVVISKCFHAFCKSCIDTNLEKRQRKCPRCKTKFGSADVKAFYWL